MTAAWLSGSPSTSPPGGCSSLAGAGRAGLGWGRLAVSVDGVGELGYRVTALHVEHGFVAPRGWPTLNTAPGWVPRWSLSRSPRREPGGPCPRARYRAARELSAGRDIATGHSVSPQAERCSTGSRRRRAARAGRDSPARPRPRAAAPVGDRRRDPGVMRRPRTEARIDATNDDLMLRRDLSARVMPALCRCIQGPRSTSLARRATGRVRRVARRTRATTSPRRSISTLWPTPRGLRVLVFRAAAERAADGRFGYLVS